MKTTLRDTTVREKGRRPLVTLSDSQWELGASDKQRLWQEGQLKISGEGWQATAKAGTVGKRKPGPRTPESLLQQPLGSSSETRLVRTPSGLGDLGEFEEPREQ